MARKPVFAEAARATTLRACWVPGVSNLHQFGRWAFAQFTRFLEALGKGHSNV